MALSNMDMSMHSEFPKDRIAIVEKQIDRLRKEVNDRISSNNMLWRASFAGLGTLFILKETLDLFRFVLLLSIGWMAFASHWLNQMLTIYRSGDAMSACELKINKLVGEVLLNHETILTHARHTMLNKRRLIIYIAAVVTTCIYWFSIWQVQFFTSTPQDLFFWQVGLLAAALVYIIAVVNFWRFLSFCWPSLKATETPATLSSEKDAT